MKYDINALTLDEKIMLLEGESTWHTNGLSGKVKRMRLMDGPHGLRLAPLESESPGYGMPTEELAKIDPTAMPSPFNLANSWDPELAYFDGKTIADDCIDFGVDVLLAPGINMKRTPLCGRNFEYYSEDPYLAGNMAKAFIEGVQSKNIGTSLKHFCLNNREHDRLMVSSDVDERTMREIYLSAFETALKARPYTVMCSYNLINGVYAAENRWLLNDVLRDELGFDGVVVSDWGATREPWRALKASLDLCMPKMKYAAGIRRAYDAGIITDAEIDESVSRILALMERTDGEKKCETDKAERYARAVNIAKETFVLLKNEDNILPIKGGNILVADHIGGMRHHAPYCGGGSAKVDVRSTRPTLFECISKLVSGKGSAVRGDGSAITPNYLSCAGKALCLARDNDACVVCVGNDATVEVEGVDRATMRLHPSIEQYIINFADLNPNVIVCVYAGSAIDMTPWIDKVKAVVMVGFAGEGVNEALADTLFGINNPSGKLSETFGRSLEDYPAGSYKGNGFVEGYGEGLFIGYRWFDEKNITPLYPFGHGLSYSTFEYSDITLNKQSETDYEVSFTVTNTSDVDGKEIAELYVSDVMARVVRPKKELKGFKKVFVKAGESVRVSIPLDFRSFAYYSVPLKRWHVENGRFDILVGASSRDIRLRGSVDIRLPETEQLSFE